MKVNRRTVPLDMISLEKKDRQIIISTHRSEIIFSALSQGSYGSQKSMSFDQLYKWILENGE